MAYALDTKTQENIERLARHWKVPKSEALKRAVRVALEKEKDEGGLLLTVRELKIQARKKDKKASRP